VAQTRGQHICSTARLNEDSGGTNSGAAYLFNGTTGDLIATLKEPTPVAGHQFGWSIVAVGSNVAVGCRSADVVHVFDGETGTWLQTLNNPGNPGDHFGWSVAATSDGNIVVGAMRNDTGGPNAGIAYLFEGMTQEPPKPPRPDPVDPPPEVVHNHFVLGVDPYVSFQPLTVGADFSFGVTGIGTIEYHPELNIPKEPLSADIDPLQFGFTTNESLGDILRKVTPISETIDATGTLRLSGDAELGGELHLTEGSTIATIDAGIGAGVNLTVSVQVGGSIARVPVVGRYLRKGVSFPIPLVGTPTYNFSHDIVLPVPANETRTEFLGGILASLYAETTLTVGAEIFFREETTASYASASFAEPVVGTFSDPVDWDNTPLATSDSGTVDISGGDLVMKTGSEVWATTWVEIEDKVDTLFFEAEFTSEEGAEGVLAVYWDSDLVGLLDERTVLDGLQDYLIPLPGVYDAGEYSLSFRLDPYTEVASSVLIANVATGYLVPEPSAFTLLLICVLCVLGYRWCACKRAG